MRPSRLTLIFAMLFAVVFTGLSCAQNDPEATAALAGAIPDMGGRTPVLAGSVQNGSLGQVVFDAQTGAVISGGFNASLNSGAKPSTPQVANDDRFDIDILRPNKPTIAGLDSLATFDGAFIPQNGPSASGLKAFRWTMVGNDPRQGGTTVIPGWAVTVDLQLLNADGTVFKVVPFAPFQTLTMESPDFEPLNYRSGRGIEFGDAVHRAQFFNIMGEHWHTLLIPRIQDHVTITVPRFVNVRLSNGQIIQARSYFTGTAADGQTFVLMLNLLFNFFFDNLFVNEINGGNFTTNAINNIWFPNTFLFSLNVNNPNAPGGCCVLGFHTFFFDPSTNPQPRWVGEYASWISPGLFGAGFQDVTALSHELAEIYGDPFLDNATPSWQFPGVPANAKVCQGNLEEGDPIEVLANATSPIPVKEVNFTFHPQNIPLLQWFEMGPTSDAIDGAFSFPDETVLPHSALPCPQ